MPIRESSFTSNVGSFLSEGHNGLYCALGAAAIVGGAIFLQSNHPYARAIRHDAEDAASDLRDGANRFADDAKDGAKRFKEGAKDAAKDVRHNVNDARRDAADAIDRQQRRY